jgi:uncharacterized protein YbaA (DUF1428 family)
MTHVDGFLIPVKTADKQAYLDAASAVAPMFKDLGALRVVECWPVDIAHDKTTDFFMAVKAEEDETVVFAWIEWPSKAVRDAAHGKMMQDPRMTGTPMPFDGKRMIFGGFAPILDQ